MMRALFVEEGVLAIPKERLMAMHSASIDAEDWLGHESGINAVLVSCSFDHGLVGLNDVGHAQRFGIAEIDFVLAGCYLVMAILDLDTHLLELVDGFLAEIVP